MGLLSKPKRWFAEQLARRLGNRAMNEDGMKAFLTKYKTVIGSGFLGVWGWAWGSGCIVPVVGLNLAAYVSCETVKDVLGYVGFFLVGAGVIDSDSFTRAKLPGGKRASDPPPSNAKA